MKIPPYDRLVVNVLIDRRTDSEIFSLRQEQWESHMTWIVTRIHDTKGFSATILITLLRMNYHASYTILWFLIVFYRDDYRALWYVHSYCMAVSTNVITFFVWLECIIFISYSLSDSVSIRWVEKRGNLCCWNDRISLSDISRSNNGCGIIREDISKGNWTER